MGFLALNSIQIFKGYFLLLGRLAQPYSLPTHRMDLPGCILSFSLHLRLPSSLGGHRKRSSACNHMGLLFNCETEEVSIPPFCCFIPLLLPSPLLWLQPPLSSPSLLPASLCPLHHAWRLFSRAQIRAFQAFFLPQCSRNFATSGSAAFSSSAFRASTPSQGSRNFTVL